MRIKLVAPAPPNLLEKLKGMMDVREKSYTTYREVLLLTMKGAYGVPEIVGIRYPPEKEEKAVAVHYGHDIRNQEEKVMESGEKDSLVYKYSQLGFNPLGEFTISDFRFSWKEFNGNFICIKELGMCFLRLYRNFPGNDTDLFAEKQRRAWSLFRDLGYSMKDLLPMDYWGFLVTTLMSQAQGSGATPQS